MAMRQSLSPSPDGGPGYVVDTSASTASVTVEPTVGVVASSPGTGRSLPVAVHRLLRKSLGRRGDDRQLFGRGHRAGSDYQALPGSVTIPFGATGATLDVLPSPTFQGFDKTVEIGLPNQPLLRH